LSLFAGAVRRLTAGQKQKPRPLPEPALPAGKGASTRPSGRGEDWIAPAEALPEPESGADILSRELERESRRYDRGIF